MDCIDHGAIRSLNAYGYHRVRHLGKVEYQHRVVLAATLGIQLCDMVGIARHSCDNPRCINPEHLVIGTQQDNVQDMMDRGRCGSRVLSPEDVAEIRRTYVCRHPEYGQTALGRRYGVDNSTIWQIVHDVSWKGE